ncbi:MAG: peptidoglycan-associated lipoprotein Pal [Myxococcota bacterium]
MTNRMMLLCSFLACAACKKTPPLPATTNTTTDAAVEATEDTQEEAVETMKANFQRVYFDFDASDLNTDSKDALSKNANIMRRFPDIRIEVQGHADQQGTTDYNLALGQKRADSVERFLIDRGVAPSRIRTVSYGEEKPLDSNDSEFAYSKNRRAEFRVLTGQTSKVEGTIED